MGLCASSNNTVKADAFSGSPVPSPVNETKEQKRGNKQGRGSSVKKTGGTTKRPQVLKKNTGIGGGGGAKVQRKISRPGANTLEVSRHGKDLRMVHQWESLLFQLYSGMPNAGQNEGPHGLACNPAQECIDL